MEKIRIKELVEFRTKGSEKSKLNFALKLKTRKEKKKKRMRKVVVGIIGVLVIVVFIILLNMV
ncbi:hypothetical protein [uncultured Chryseobacterium sp.]|uniref:hypothetical protein n=1 Tax=uncultured Chryseobacterium sp. TaxID=259322 RepID=UPI0025F02B60|nr:hypothetical protein [uncultured Chryseobacterium sp.]